MKFIDYEWEIQLQIITNVLVKINRELFSRLSLVMDRLLSNMASFL